MFQQGLKPHSQSVSRLIFSLFRVNAPDIFFLCFLHLTRHVLKLVQFFREFLQRDIFRRALVEVSAWRGRWGTLCRRVCSVGHGGEPGLVLHPQRGAPEAASELHGGAQLLHLRLALVGGLARPALGVEAPVGAVEAELATRVAAAQLRVVGNELLVVLDPAVAVHALENEVLGRMRDRAGVRVVELVRVDSVLI